MTLGKACIISEICMYLGVREGLGEGRKIVPTPRNRVCYKDLSNKQYTCVVIRMLTETKSYDSEFSIVFNKPV